VRRIQISPPFVPENVDVSQIDEVIRCTTADALATAQNLAKLDGKNCSLHVVYGLYSVA
jgi:cysteine synthase